MLGESRKTKREDWSARHDRRMMNESHLTENLLLWTCIKTGHRNHVYLAVGLVPSRRQGLVASLKTNECWFTLSVGLCIRSSKERLTLAEASTNACIQRIAMCIRISLTRHTAPLRDTASIVYKNQPHVTSKLSLA